ncbi:hypothetical protein Tco_1377915 [Tanacetum coccineum]
MLSALRRSGNENSSEAQKPLVKGDSLKFYLITGWGSGRVWSYLVLASTLYIGKLLPPSGNLHKWVEFQRISLTGFQLHYPFSLPERLKADNMVRVNRLDSSRISQVTYRRACLMLALEGFPSVIELPPLFSASSASSSRSQELKFFIPSLSDRIGNNAFIITIYWNFVESNAIVTLFCLFDDQLTSLSPNNYIPPDVLHLVS